MPLKKYISEPTTGGENTPRIEDQGLKRVRERSERVPHSGVLKGDVSRKEERVKKKIEKRRTGRAHLFQKKNNGVL